MRKFIGKIQGNPKFVRFSALALAISAAVNASAVDPSAADILTGATALFATAGALAISLCVFKVGKRIVMSLAK